MRGRIDEDPSRQRLPSPAVQAFAIDSMVTLCIVQVSNDKLSILINFVGRIRRWVSNLTLLLGWGRRCHRASHRDTDVPVCYLGNNEGTLGLGLCVQSYSRALGVRLNCSSKSHIWPLNFRLKMLVDSIAICDMQRSVADRIFNLAYEFAVATPPNHHSSNTTFS